MQKSRNMYDGRPMWKVLVSLVFSLLGTVLVLYAGWSGIQFFMPFVIGWFLSFIANPLVIWFEKRLRIQKKLGSAIIIIIVLVGCVALIYFAVSSVWTEISGLVSNFPDLYKEMEKGFQTIGERGHQLFQLLPGTLKESFGVIMANLNQSMGELIGRISEPTVAAAGNIAKKIPSILIATIVTIISAYFFIAEREEVIAWAKRISPEPLVRRMTMIIDNLKYAAGGYLRAQFKIMAVVFLILLAGFWVLGIHFSILLAIGIAFLDFLPFFGTGTALIPWALYELLVGEYRMMIGLAVLYAVTQLVRQLVQPKLVGDSMGLNPLATLILLYGGYKAAGLLGMIFAVPAGMIVVNLYKAGAFDYILDDVKLLVGGVMDLRKGTKEQ